MDFLDTDLKTILKGENLISFDIEHVMTILYNLLCALNFIHTTNILHRDIKPANILIDDDCLIKICDFGLARTFPQIPQEKNLSRKDSLKSLGSMDTADNSADRLTEKSDQKEKIQRRRDIG